MTRAILAPLWVLLTLSACSAPDYTPVREWAATGGLAVNLGRESLRPVRVNCLPDAAGAGLDAMQEALATYLSAIGVLADDGVLPHHENPFGALEARVAELDAQGATAVASLGALLRRTSRANAQAPQLRGFITQADPLVQALVVALAAAVRNQAPRGEAPDEGSPRAQYARLVVRVGAAHAMLKADAAVITRDKVVQRIRAAEGELRLALATLPRPMPLLAAGRAGCAEPEA